MEEALLVAKLKDAVRLSSKGPRYIGFLDPAETAALTDVVRNNNGAEFHFFGGFPEAERKMLAVTQFYDSPPSFPISAITLTYREQDNLSHRDFLGSLMAQGVERSSVGDILVEEGRAVVFVKSELLSYFLENIKKIGRKGVRAARGFDTPLPPSHDYIDIGGVVASERLDCVVAFATKTSREKASSLISSGLVNVNYREVTSVSHKMCENDIITIRHTGKFLLDRLGPLTKKGRLSIQLRKYV